MKISDPIGKVYQHSMFKKKSYNIPKGGDGDILDRHRSHTDEEDDDDASDISDQSDDSLSTKSSRASPSRRTRARSSSRHRRPRDQEDPGERDREDAISYASRNERGDRNRSSSRRRAKRSASTKKYGLENLGPPGTSYSLWTTQKSLKRDHKRRFNRSMCGVLLGVSIVLVVLGILGIIGIAVYLGVVQKIESPAKDLVSIDGAFRVTSEDFSLSLLNPASLDYKENERKFTNILEKTFRKSHLRDAFVRIIIDGFSSGSIKVFFKVILDKTKIPEKLQDEVVMATKDVMMQEVMSLDRSEFSDTIIDIDSIDFSMSKIQEVAAKYLEPEPYQGEKTTTEYVNSGGLGGGSLWQNLAQSTARSVLRPNNIQDNSPMNNWPTATERQETIDRIDNGYDGYEDEIPLNANGWSLPKYPVNMMYDLGRPNNLVPTRYPQIVTPQTPVIVSPPGVRKKFPGSGFQSSGLSPMSPSYPPTLGQKRFPSPTPGSSSRRGPATSGDLMSEYMEPPPPPSPSSNSESLNLETLFQNQNPTRTNTQSASSSEINYRMTPKPQQQTQNRRVDQEDYNSERFNGFWNMLHPEKKQQTKKTMPESQFQNRMSSKDDRISSMQEELEHLLMLESQENGVGPSLYDQIQLMDDNEIQQLADQLVPLLDSPQNNNKKFNQQPGNSWQRGKPQKPQDPVSINNFGSSGLKQVKTNNLGFHGSSTTPRSSTVVDIHVPQGQDTGFFGVGSSLSFSGGGNNVKRQGVVGNTNTIMNSVGSLNSDQLIQNSVPLGADPNIVYPHQIRAGTQMMQGPQGPIVSSPRPHSLTVAQTPLAPQLPSPQTRDKHSGHYNSAPGKRQQLPGLSGRTQSRPVSGSLSSSNLVSVVSPPSPPKQNFQQMLRSESKQQQQQVPNRRQGMAGERQDIIGNILPAAIGLSSSAGISPIGIFSNLLNAYATIDSKHDLTGKLVNSAVSWLNPKNPTSESRTTDVGTSTTLELPTSTTSTTTPSTTSFTSMRNKNKKKKKTEATTVPSLIPVTNVNVQVNEEDNQYQSIFDKIRAAANGKESEYDIVTSYDSNLPPVKSNVFSDGPLRPKPPSEDIIQVSPAPHDYNQEDPALQYGVSNPHWYSNEIQASTAGYGPDDFIVETVNLDKNFFYQFFTSKPMIIDTDVVTSTSVQVKYDSKLKKGRESAPEMDYMSKSSRETLMNLPEHLVGKDILPDHIFKRTGELEVNDDGEEVEVVKAVPQSAYKRYSLPTEIKLKSGRIGKELETSSKETRQL